MNRTARRRCTCGDPYCDTCDRAGFHRRATATAALLVLITAVLVAAGTVGGYRHPCAEDEYVRVDGACVHVDDLAARR